MRRSFAAGLASDLCILAWRLLLEPSSGVATTFDIDIDAVNFLVSDG